MGKFDKYFFGWLDLTRDILGIQNNLKTHGSACVTTSASMMKKQTPKIIFYFFSLHLLPSGNFQGSEIWHGNFWGLIFCPGIC